VAEKLQQMMVKDSQEEKSQEAQAQYYAGQGILPEEAKYGS
jgi:hypothetical protein